jgi:hypothetical protein
MLNLFSIKIDSKPQVLNNSTYVPIETDPSLAVKTPGTFATATGALAGTQVTYDTPKAAGWEATEGSFPSELLAEYWQKKIRGGVYVLAKSVIDAAFGLVTSGNYSNAEGTDKLTSAIADFGVDDMANLRTYGVTKIKDGLSAIIVNSQVAGRMFYLASGMYNPVQNEMYTTGKLPRQVGIDTYEYTGLPANGEGLVGMVIGKSAICAAVSYFDPLMTAGDGNIVNRSVITEPSSGLSVLYTEKADAGGTLSGEVQLLFGVAKGRDAIVRLVTA